MRTQKPVRTDDVVRAIRLAVRRVVGGVVADAAVSCNITLRSATQQRSGRSAYQRQRQRPGATTDQGRDKGARTQLCCAPIHFLLSSTLYVVGATPITYCAHIRERVRASTQTQGRESMRHTATPDIGRGDAKATAALRTFHVLLLCASCWILTSKYCRPDRNTWLPSAASHL